MLGIHSGHPFSRPLAPFVAAGGFLVILGAAALFAQAPVQTSVSPPATTTPRRPLPENRFDFRGEHAGVIYTPQGWSPLGDGADRGQSFMTPGGYSVFIPFAYAGPTTSEPVALGTSYEIVDRRASAAVARRNATTPSAPASGHYEVRAQEEPIDGEFIEVYHPAVYETDDQGRPQLVQAEETTHVPKVRVVLRRVWVDGPAPKALPSKSKVDRQPSR